MPRAKSKLNRASSEVIEKSFLEETPEGFQEPEFEINQKIVFSNHIPEMRRVVFVNGRDPDQELHFHLHTATHPLKHYTLFHGKEYELPVEVIEHLESRVQNQYGYRQGPNGHPEMYIKGHRYLFSCKSPRKVA